MVRITRAIDFSCSLRCRRPDLSDEENRALFGPRVAQHGHNYRLEVTIRGEPDPVTGMVLDLKDLQTVLGSFGHDLDAPVVSVRHVAAEPEALCRLKREVPESHTVDHTSDRRVEPPPIHRRSPAVGRRRPGVGATQFRERLPAAAPLTSSVQLLARRPW